MQFRWNAGWSCGHTPSSSQSPDWEVKGVCEGQEFWNSWAAAICLPYPPPPQSRWSTERNTGRHKPRAPEMLGFTFSPQQRGVLAATAQEPQSSQVLRSPYPHQSRQCQPQKAGSSAQSWHSTFLGTLLSTPSMSQHCDVAEGGRAPPHMQHHSGISDSLIEYLVGHTK